MAPIGVGIVGYGKAAKTFHIPLIDIEDRLQLRAIASGRPDVVKAEVPDVVTYRDVETLVRQKDIDLVVIAGRNIDHFGQSKVALMADKHVVVEKPMTVTSAEADELLDISKSRGLLLSVFHNRRWDNGLLTLESLLRTGTLGSLAVCSLRFDRFVPMVSDRWRDNSQPGSGMLYDLGSHLLFAALTLFGMPQSLIADVGIQRPGAKVDDFFDISLNYDTLRVQLRASLLVPANQLAMEAHGDEGSFIKHGVDPQEAMLKSGFLPHTAEWAEYQSDNNYSLTTTTTGTETHTLGPGHYDEFYAGIANTILDNSAPPIRPQTARDCIALIERCFTAAKSGRRVEL